MGNVTAKTSGEIANFMTPAKTNIKSLKVHFSPKQLGTGDPSPENVREIVGWDGVEVNGCGKNLCPAATGIDIQSWKLSSGNRIYNIYNLNPNIPYTLSATITTDTSSNSQKRLYLSGKTSPFINTSIAGRRSITVYPTDTGILTISHNYTGLTNIGEYLIDIQLEEGSTATSYEPYQGNNISYDFTNNYLNKIQITNNKTINSSGEEITESKMSLTDYIPVNENEEWFLSFTSTTAARTRRIWGYDEDKQVVSELAKISWATVGQELTLTATIPNNVKFIRVCYFNEDTDLILSINGLSLKNVYGGYVDLISGELVQEYNRKVFTGSADDNLSYYKTQTIRYLERHAFHSTCLDRIIKNNSSKFVFSNNSIQYYDATDKDSILFYVGTPTKQVYFAIDSSLCDPTVESFSNWLNENNIDFVYQLATPITHQLTPTQLQSFIGQNNFWSNADYVEIEYDLIETEDIQKARQKIILNQPQLKTISDKIVSFNTDMVAPMKNCKIYFNPIQLGSGDPSPTNVRNINGWTSIDSYVNGDKISVDWTSDAGTVYGGYLDLAKKEVVATHHSFTLDGINYFVESGAETHTGTDGALLAAAYNYIGGNSFKNLPMGVASSISNSISNKYLVTGNNKIIGIQTANVGSPYYCLVVNASELDDVSDRTAIVNSFKTWLQNNPIQICYKLANPIHYSLTSLTSQQLLTLKSTNHIWSETNGLQIDVKYWTYKNLTPTSLTDYLENQTWIDSAYISSSGKKTTNTVSASHFLTNQILLEAGTYVLSGFSHYVGTDNTNYRIHAYDSSGKWLKQITFQQIGNLSPVDISFTLDTDTYVNVSIAMDFDGVLAKIN